MPSDSEEKFVWTDFVNIFEACPEHHENLSFLKACILYLVFTLFTKGNNSQLIPLKGIKNAY